MQRLLFLGTGGGRFATISQERATGGIYLSNDEMRLVIDPGPGALVHLTHLGIDPTKIDAVLISHCHPDHYNDAEILIESMSIGGTKKRGALLASRSIIDGVNGIGPCISRYHRSKLETIVEMAYDEGAAENAQTHCVIGAVRIEPTFVKHNDPSSIGFKIRTDDGVIAYVSDTAFHEKLVECNKDARVLILPVTTGKRRIDYHLCTEDAATLVEAIRPECVLLTHFGLKLIRSGPEKEAHVIEKQTGIKTVAATDFMAIGIGVKISFEK